MRDRIPTIGSGATIGYLAGGHPWLVLIVGLAVGWVARDLYSAARWAAMAVATSYSRKHPERALARRLLRSRVPY
jgi:hypothetical protein